MEPSQRLIQQLKRDEGDAGPALKAYLDTQQVPTIGYGRNLRACHPGVPDGALLRMTCTAQEAEQWLLEDARQACDWLKAHLPWTQELDDARLGALQNMSFQLQSRLLGFHRMLTLMQDHSFEQAAGEMMNSLWARQCPNRAERLAQQARTGVWQ